MATLSRLTLLPALLASLGLQAQTKLLRFPDIHGDRVVFTHGSDLWTAPATGGTATRLTAHPGLEVFAKFSPDGKWIAFTGQYDGDEQVYVMPSTGGVPRQLTFYPAQGPGAPRHGYDHQVMGWTPDGKSILFRGRRDANSVTSTGALYTVALEGGLPKPLPMPNAGAGDFSPEGTRILYSPLQRDFRHWKRYEGGWAQDLYVFDLTAGTHRRIAHSKRTERDPMWLGNKAYFLSDRDGKLNLYQADTGTDTVQQLTFEKTWDLRWASSDNRSRIVYERDAELAVFDTTTGKATPIAITVPTDGGASRPSRLGVERNIEEFGLSPKGERALFVARGEVFTAPLEKGPTRNLTATSGAHDRLADWSPDGRQIAFVSDQGGEEQVYVVDQDGTSKPTQLTTGLKARLTGLTWSPEGKRLALTDKDGKVLVLTLADKKVQEVADDAYGRVGDPAWSPDGAFLAFSLANENRTRSLYIWSAAEGRTRKVTGDFFSTAGPAWDKDGRFLYALSTRDFAPQISTLEWNYAGARNTGIFAYALRQEGPHPFPAESDEVSLGEKKEEPKGPVAVRIDWEGLEDRGVRVPVPADNLGGLQATKGHLLYMKNPPFFYGRDGGAQPSLWIFDLKKRTETELAPGIFGWNVSGDGQKVLVRSAQGFQVLDAKPGAKDRKPVSTRELAVDRIPAEEWAGVYDEVWRRYRDFFYVKNMHGYDWEALRERYRPWLKHVTHRSDLTYILTELIAELNVGHAYVEGGDQFLPERARVGLPGARFELDAKAGRYRIAKIFRGQNEEPKYRSPLTEVGVEAKVGDYVLAIDGEELKAMDNPYRLLRNKVHPVTLSLASKPGGEGARKVTYRPIFEESSLVYLDFVLTARERVEKASGGKQGYLHVPDMGAEGVQEFIKAYYPQIRKEGLVIDVRNNGGGNISEMLLNRLGTKLLGTRFGYSSESIWGTYPSNAYHGHLVCLINETSASDGDIFPYHFRVAGLGPLVGKRTWGGVVGISGTGPLLDGGQVSVPLFASTSPTGQYIIEGEGVSPDIEVDQDPAAVLKGQDPQLERGIAEVMKKVQAEPRVMPKKPKDPVKTK